MAGAAEDPDGLTPYELQRLAHIRRNHEYMLRLGVAGAADALGGAAASAASKPRRRKRDPDRVPAEPTRKSARLLNVPAERPEGLEDSEDEEEKEPEERALRDAERRAARVAEQKALVAQARDWLRESREKVLAVGKGGALLPGGEQGWRDEAVKRWGHHVPAECGVGFESYVRSRLGTPPSPSALELLQEFYSHDAWMLLCACSLMSRVSSWEVKHNVIAAFFLQYPTPSAVIDAEVEPLQKLLHPLGLFPSRLKSLLAISTWVLECTDIAFDVGLQPPLKVYGCGAFTVDSFNIFFKGQLSTKPGDATLQSFVAWQKRHAAKKEREA